MHRNHRPVCSYLHKELGMVQADCPRKNEGEKTYEDCKLRRLLYDAIVEVDGEK